MWDHYITAGRINPEAPEPHPIADDTWPEVAITAALPPAVLAARRGSAREERGR
jgi:hypothetical protein